MVAKKRIGILTSGGDCSGLNAIIRAAVHRATGTYGWEILGIQQATVGLMSDPPKYLNLDVAEVDQWLLDGGTKLGTTNKNDPFAFPMDDGTVSDRTGDIIAGYHKLGLDALIGIGGDGSLGLLRRIAQQGNLNLVGVPKTIDNDVEQTEIAVGFHTAVNIATEALDRLQFTASSHSRVMVLEVMGRDAGHIALSAGIAGGADFILIPEIPYTLSGVCAKVKQRLSQGKNYSLVIVAEAAKPTDGATNITQTLAGENRYGGIGHYLAEQIYHCSGAETRATVLGHIQRGGIPAPMDRLVASAFGVAAVDLIAQEKYDYVVTWQKHQIVPVPLGEIVNKCRLVHIDDTLVKTALGLGIYLGDDLG
ncbi:MAG: ATP-dependent 6-phosphofructokinase [Microcoleaceae cyanobacterium]